ncbi:nucleoside hydrolase [Halioxenophilus sp. WMMB6]|uniref:nucleoside hydrolase n=1 Tax=Halioxenophilus sp. WMMB6 TaxID=3073815 RepID=UPI00295E4A74|nr:nucleoside hydrolase [Halioxenophilus sp. WMMB6]
MTDRLNCCYRSAGKVTQRTKAALLALLLALVAAHTRAEPEKIIIDADVGIDDAMAILLAHASPELEVVGITTVFGNATIENSTRNALYLTQRLQVATPVVQGARKPLVLPEGPPTDFVHGANGLGNYPVNLAGDRIPLNLTAAEFIIEQSHIYPGELTLVPVGRLTNIALALALDPTLPSRIKQVVLMGGAFHHPGNVTPVAEANIIGDPHAADVVFGAPWQKLVAIGLDVTTQLVVGPKDLAAITKKNPTTGQFLEGISAFYLNFYRSVGVEEGFYLHDPAAILYVIKPELFNLEGGPVRVITEGIAIGQTIAATADQAARLSDWQATPASLYAVGVEQKKGVKLFLSRLQKLPLSSE